MPEGPEKEKALAALDKIVVMPEGPEGPEKEKALAALDKIVALPDGP